MEETSKILRQNALSILMIVSKKKKKKRQGKIFVLNWAVMLDRLNEKQS